MAILNINTDNFDEQVIASEKPVIVDFYADWCGPCKMLAPTIEEIANEANDEFFVGKVNIDDNMDLASRFSIANIPTLIVFKNGEEAQRVIGLKSKQDIINLVK